MNHKKQDRLFALAAARRLPVVLFAEGGGGRPGDTDVTARSLLDVDTFRAFARLAGQVPLIGVASGRCFAGNAVLLAGCDVIVATANASIGMGGPVMIEGAGLPAVAADLVGPAATHALSGAVDVVVADEAAATVLARLLLACAVGQRVAAVTPPDTSVLRTLVSETRTRPFAMTAVLAAVFDVGSVVVLGAAHGPGMVTAVARLDGRWVGVLANDAAHSAGALDLPGCQKATRFLRRAAQWRLPIVSLVDTPGFMVGPAVEATGLVRAAGDMLAAAAAVTTPWLACVVRKAYGLGAMAMAGGSMHAPFLSLAWPTGEFGAMGLDGAVRLASRANHGVVPDAATVTAGVAALRDAGKAVAVAAHFEVDAVIDPAATRDTLVQALQRCDAGAGTGPGHARL